MIVVVHAPKPFVYGVVPKTGSTTIRTMIRRNWSTRREAHTQEDMARDYEGYATRWPSYPWFTSVRNPLSRAVALWSEYRYQPIKAHAVGHFRRLFEVIKATNSFEEALYDKDVIEAEFWTKHTQMCVFLQMMPRVDGHIRLEHLAADLKRHLLRYTKGRPAAIPHLRIGGYRSRDKKQWQEHYTPGCYAKVREYMQPDFDYCLKHNLYSPKDLNDPLAEGAGV